MGTLEFTREQLAQYILNTAKESSISKIKAIILDEDKDQSICNLTNEQLDGLDRRRDRYLAGEGNSYSWEEVKQELKDKHGLRA